MLSRRLEDVIRLRLQKTSSRHLQDVLIKTNIFALLKCFQKRSSRSLIKTNIFVLVIRLQDVFKTFSKHLQDVSQKRLQDALQNTSSRHLQDVFKSFSRCLQEVFKTSSDFLLRLPQDVFKSKMSLRHLQNVLKMF